MNVLSLFDGMSFGMMALLDAKIPIKNYFASEIDPHAVKVSKFLFPSVKHIGDINNWTLWREMNYLPKIDLLIGGSPRRGFSIAGKRLNFDDPRSKLFFTYVDILRAYKPKYFLLENVKMLKEIQDRISSLLGVEPIKINSALVSAQNRERLYWTNVPGVGQPEDRGILLKDVLEDGSERVGASRGRYVVNGVRQDHKMKVAGLTKQRLEVRKDFKSNCLTTVGKDSLVIRNKSKCVRSGGRGKWDSVDNSHTRKLTVRECARLQTMPEPLIDQMLNSGVSPTQLYKMLGNGWTMKAVSHIFKNLNTRSV